MLWNMFIFLCLLLQLKDDLARSPVDCIPDVVVTSPDSGSPVNGEAKFVNGTGDNTFEAASDEQVWSQTQI